GGEVCVTGFSLVSAVNGDGAPTREWKLGSHSFLV
ncbi:MAG: hypothetical protein RIQ34_811, partial [Bacteroidota bacterium]